MGFYEIKTTVRRERETKLYRVAVYRDRADVWLVTSNNTTQQVINGSQVWRQVLRKLADENPAAREEMEG